ncbi:DUF1772 domain-containing protein [Actinomadura algeriensis]|uniref:DUF1772 domain-containing protein n=1 Tax=Actinomadura algeriensis TaxID=1679523 RepID=A0ABR9JJ83_9ACTN|nr:DUF1772 domain-containing protein [Actinomadura algeriensis]MBE1530519.1 hypothetical protein [Actinomadura algeriensis]
MIEPLLPAAFLANGLCAGVLVGSMLGVVPYYRTLSEGDYIRAHAFSVGRYDPFQPICLLITVAADVAAAVAADGAARLLCASAAALAAAVIAVTLTRNLPMNRRIRRVDPDAPAGFRAGPFLRRWAAWHALRTALAVLALLVNAAAVGVLL